jgi:hypothetical protein
LYKTQNLPSILIQLALFLVSEDAKSGFITTAWGDTILL